MKSLASVARSARAVSVTGLGVAALLAPPALAQWTDDPGTNSTVVAQNGGQVQPKLAPTPDGGAYVSWFDNRVGGHDVYMQRLDSAGAPVWQDGGVLVAERSFSSTQDYGLAIDDDGHAIVAFRGDSTGDIDVTVARVAPDGTLVWGAGGVQPSLGSGTIGAIRAAGTSDGGSVVGWLDGSDARVVKLDSDGNEQWVRTITPPANAFTVSGLVPSDEPGETGQVVVIMTTFGGFIVPRHIYAQKLDADGTPMWNEPVPIHTGSSIQIGYFPGGMPDGAGGMVMAWYETSPLQVRAQRVDADGNLQFPANGVVVSTNAAQLRVSPDAAYNPDTGDIYVAWTETNVTQGQHGLYAQKIDAAGDRQWTDNGLELIPVGGNEITQVRTLLSDAGAEVYFAFRLSPAVQHLRATSLDADGDFVWPGDFVDVSNAGSAKSRLVAARNADGRAVLVWQDDRDGPDNIYTQNVNQDGTLGIAGGPCSPADLAEPFGVLDIFDVLEFLSLFEAEDPRADLAEPFGTFDIFDVLEFLSIFEQGCP